MTTQIVPEVGQQLAKAYERAQTELADNYNMPSIVWEETLNNLQEIDFAQPVTLNAFVEAHAGLAILEQTLVATAVRDGFGTRSK